MTESWSDNPMSLGDSGGGGGQSDEFRDSKSPSNGSGDDTTPLNASGRATLTVAGVASEVVYGKYGLNNMTRVDLIGDKLRHYVDDEEEDLGYDGMVEESGVVGGLDHWAVPTTAAWKDAVVRNR